MGAYDFWWNAHQSGQIDDLERENKELRKEIDQLTLSLNGWVEHFNQKIRELEEKK